MARADEEIEKVGVFYRRMVLEYEELLCRVFSSGYSVVEITRMIRSKKAITVYRTLQGRGLIERAVRKSRYRGPVQLENRLRRVHLSFTQWCNSWRFDPKTAEVELASPGTCDPSGVRLAAARDFPNLFEKCGGSMDLEKWEREISSATRNHSFHIEWNPRFEKYVGTIPGIDSLMITGRYPSVILMELSRVTWLLRAIDILGGSVKEIEGSYTPVG